MGGIRRYRRQFRRCGVIGGMLIDTGFFFALHRKSDDHHAAASAKKELLDTSTVILPWPILYETLNTRFVGTPDALDWFDQLVQSPNTELLDDSKYREMSYQTVLTDSSRKRRLSLVDVVLRSIIEDPNVRVAGILTFNHRDFVDVCQRHQVEMV